jgi:hypothetical protein
MQGSGTGHVRMTNARRLQAENSIDPNLCFAALISSVISLATAVQTNGLGSGCIRSANDQANRPVLFDRL